MKRMFCQCFPSVTHKFTAEGRDFNTVFSSDRETFIKTLASKNLGSRAPSKPLTTEDQNSSQNRTPSARIEIPRSQNLTWERDAHHSKQSIHPQEKEQHCQKTAFKRSENSRKRANSANPLTMVRLTSFCKSRKIVAERTTAYSFSHTKVNIVDDCAFFWFFNLSPLPLSSNQASFDHTHNSSPSFTTHKKSPRYAGLSSSWSAGGAPRGPR